MDKSNLTPHSTQHNDPDRSQTNQSFSNVYVWDMDETLILLKSLLDGTFAEGFNGSKDMKRGKEIGKQWEGYILRVCDELFFYEQIENYNEPFIDSLKEYDDGRDLSGYNFSRDGAAFPQNELNQRDVAYRHRVIAEKYEQGLRKFYEEKHIEQWNILYNLTDSYTDGWLTSARALLEQLSSRNECSEFDATCSTNPAFYKKNESIHVLVTSGSLIPSLAKCLLFRLDGLILKENVFSSWDVGKLQCFQWIKDKFGGSTVHFCAIGDGLEECFAAERMGWPFVKIELHPQNRNRFPGLSTNMLQCYMDVIYGESTKESKNDEP